VALYSAVLVLLRSKRACRLGPMSRVYLRSEGDSSLRNVDLNKIQDDGYCPKSQ
jgi:hypothetical protein